MRPGQPEAERRVRVWLCPVDGAGGGGRPPCVVRPFFSRTRRWSVTSNLLDHPPFASVTICRVAQCRHHQLEGPPGPVLCLPSCWGPFRDPCRGSMWPLWPEPRFASSVEKCFKGKPYDVRALQPVATLAVSGGSGWDSDGCASHFRSCLWSDRAQPARLRGVSLSRGVFRRTRVPGPLPHWSVDGHGSVSVPWPL